MRLSFLAMMMVSMLDPSLSVVQTQASLPSSAQEDFAKGLSAAKREAWDEAFESLYRALAPLELEPRYSPPIYYNLGVVLEKVGAQLEAAACFQAYLELAPDATNRGEVEKEIVGLTKARAAQIDLVFQRATEGLQRLEIGMAKDHGLREVALAHAAAGKIARAVDLVKVIPKDKASARIPDLYIPIPWVQYAATLTSADMRGLNYLFRLSSFPNTAQRLLDRLDKTFPMPPRIDNPNDPIVGSINLALLERSNEISAVKKAIGEARSELSSDGRAQPVGLTQAGRKVIAFANLLINDLHSSDKGINTSVFDLENNIKSALDPNDRLSSFSRERGYGGSECATAVSLAGVAGRFGAGLFRFELLRRGAAAGAYALERPEIDEALWNSLNDATTSDRFQGYLAWFPKGRFAELATLKIRTMEAESRLASTPATVSVEEALRRAGEAEKVSNYPEQLKWLRMAADQGNDKAQMELAFMYVIGRGVPTDHAEALRWYRKAADQGNAQAVLEIGSFYQIGRGVAKDPAEAERWYRKALDQGSDGALSSLSGLFEELQNYSEAIKWYKKGAEKGWNSSRFALGRFYENGLGVDRNIRTAIYWYKLAAAGDEYMPYTISARDALKRLGQVAP